MTPISLSEWARRMRSNEVRYAYSRTSPSATKLTPLDATA